MAALGQEPLLLDGTEGVGRLHRHRFVNGCPPLGRRDANAHAYELDKVRVEPGVPGPNQRVLLVKPGLPWGHQ
jgi:hypothetical protein